MDFIKSLLAALPQAASSPYAFVAYICVVMAWFVIALKVKRNAQLLTHLRELPAKDRLTALQLEMGTIRIKEHMTAEQWLRARVYSYIFYAFCILCLAGVVVFVIACTVKKPGTASVDMTPYNSPLSPDSGRVKSPTAETIDQSVPAVVAFRKGGSDGAVDNAFDATSGHNIYPEDPELTLTYDYDRENGKIIVVPKMPYLSKLSQGGPIAGIEYSWSPFTWQFPKLSIKIVNNTERTLAFTEAAVRVSESTIDTAPVIVIHENMYNVGNLAVVNEGWGKVIDPSLDLGIIEESACNTFPRETPGIHVARSTFGEADNVPIIEYVPAELKAERAVCVFGKIQFTTESEVKQSLNFSTLVSLVTPGPGAPAPPRYLYDLYLKAGNAGYTTRVPISEEVKPGDVDHFIIRIGTDKSATFNLTFSFLSEPIVTLTPTQVLLSVFVPRSQVQASELRSRASVIRAMIKASTPPHLAKSTMYLVIEAKDRPDYRGHITFLDNQQFHATGHFNLPGEEGWQCDADLDGIWMQPNDKKLIIKDMHVSPRPLTFEWEAYVKNCASFLKDLSTSVWSTSCSFADSENCKAPGQTVWLHPW